MSAVRVIEEAKARAIPILNLTSDNYTELSPSLNAPSAVKIDIFQATTEGKTVIIPQETIDFYQWQSTGYIITDPETGGSTYRLSGGLSGGSTAIKVVVGTVGDMGLALQVASI